MLGKDVCIKTKEYQSSKMLVKYYTNFAVRVLHNILTFSSKGYFGDICEVSPCLYTPPLPDDDDNSVFYYKLLPNLYFK